MENSKSPDSRLVGAILLNQHQLRLGTPFSGSRFATDAPEMVNGRFPISPESPRRPPQPFQGSSAGRGALEPAIMRDTSGAYSRSSSGGIGPSSAEHDWPRADDTRERSNCCSNGGGDDPPPNYLKALF